MYIGGVRLQNDLRYRDAYETMKNGRPGVATRSARIPLSSAKRTWGMLFLWSAFSFLFACPATGFCANRRRDTVDKSNISPARNKSSIILRESNKWLVENLKIQKTEKVIRKIIFLNSVEGYENNALYCGLLKMSWPHEPDIVENRYLCSKAAHSPHPKSASLP